MNLKNCPKCGKLFAVQGSEKICPVCKKEEEDDFQKVKEYLWDNPGATIEEVHEETGVERETIIKFVKEDRLIAEGLDLEILLECERCGDPITHGRFCEKCQQELVEGLSPTPRKKKKPRKKTKRTRDKMFIADRVVKRKKNTDQ
ncbi:TIGR03826 family flagellar region protein [Halothermothrix orenii]|uniref:Flagellar protein n=1 Tax=Halothermothrix orenii (strain H 168 / OCM 544 / DSM 9562) TaxID=373903 RepID=B8CYU7_HALOH|nr:TIGR03826 family flagellar region protein [Halothermothrix orenii]ACL70466.1 flagellar protein [Halothermothrix orenii H 168]